jgi:LysR family transcriptional regulator for metE and metH
MLLETRHLMLVHEIAAQGGVTRASKRLFLTQSAVSHQLLDLERRLGTRLFYRAGKRMVPTVAGQRVLEAAQSTLGRLQELEDELRRIALGQEAVLRLSTQCYTCYHWLPSMLGEYQRRFPHVDVQIIAEATCQPVPALLDGRIDLGVVHEDSGDERLCFTKLFRDEMLLLVSSEHRLARKRYMEPEDLRGEHLILYGIPLPESLFYQEVLVPSGVQPRKISHIQLTEAIVELVRANVGVTVLARWAAAPYLADGRLVGLRISARGLARQWYAATIKQNPVPLHLREFIQMIRLGPGAGEEVRTA